MGGKDVLVVICGSNEGGRSGKKVERGKGRRRKRGRTTVGSDDDRVDELSEARALVAELSA